MGGVVVLLGIQGGLGLLGRLGGGGHSFQENNPRRPCPNGEVSTRITT